MQPLIENGSHTTCSLFRGLSSSDLTWLDLFFIFDRRETANRCRSFESVEWRSPSDSIIDWRNWYFPHHKTQCARKKIDHYPGCAVRVKIIVQPTFTFTSNRPRNLTSKLVLISYDPLDFASSQYGHRVRHRLRTTDINRNNVTIIM